MKKHRLFPWAAAAAVAASSFSAFPAMAEEPEFNVCGGNYTEGVAIVLTYGMPLVQGDSDETDAEVVQTLEFDLQPKSRIEDFPILKSSSAGADSFSISLVRSETETTEELIARMKQKSNVVYAEPNRIAETNSVTDSIDSMWGLCNFGQNNGTPGSDINADTLKGSLSDESIVIALVDTGIDLSHPDLQPYIWNNPYAESGELTGEHGYDCADSDSDPTDNVGHGTHCAGIMTSVFEQTGADNVEIMTLKIFETGGEECESFAQYAAYKYIYDAQNLGVNIKAVNNSWGSAMFGQDSQSDIMNLLITLVGQNGAVSVFSAGNDSSNSDLYETFPAGLDNPYIVCVAATDERDNLAFFSNYGAESVDLAAPGVNILSTYNEPYFEPDAFSEEEKAEFIEMTEDFSSDIPTALEGENLCDGIDKGKTMLVYGTPLAEQNLSLSDEFYFGAPEKASSLCWEYTVPEDGSSGVLYLPIPYSVAAGEKRDYCIRFWVETEGTSCSMTTMESTVSEDGTFEKSNIYVSRTGEYSDEINGRWNTIASRMNGDKNGKYAIAWRFDNLTPGGKVRLYLDDFNVSKLNCGENYPKYVYMRGTSMSTPYVTAAAGVLALYNPNADALERVQDLLCSTRPAASLNGKVKTGGVLDLSRIDSGKPCVIDSVLNAETGELTLTGRNLTDIKDYTSDSFADVKTKSHTDTEMILDVSDYERAFMNLSFYDEEGALVYKTTDFCPSGIIPETAATVPRQSTDSFENNVFTIGGKFYSYDSGGYIYELNETDGWTLFDGSGFPETEDAQPGVVRTEAADGNKLYVSVAYRMSGKTASQIVCYDFENRTWTNCGFPKEVTSCTAFTAGDNKLWFIGEQADEQYNRLIVCSYDPNTQETVHISETPFFSMEPHCFWIQSKLVVSVDTMVNPFTEKTVPQAIYDPETDSWQICEPITSEPM